jgi:uncharacterized protein
MKSAKELSLDKKILSHLSGEPRKVAELLLHDEEAHCMQEYSNSVSIVRLGFNDHGPVHMRTVSLNAIIMMNLLRRAGIKTSLEAEDTGTWEESLCAVLLAAYLHDLGMAIGRQDHELHSAILAQPIIDRVLRAAFPDQLAKTVTIRALALEGIVGHMATRRIHSLEAGLILVADGCDMEKGRARIPLFLNTEPRMGDIHKYSANSIEHVEIEAGAEKPIKIVVEMSSDVGFFQVEEVLLPKIEMSPAKSYLELYAGIRPEEMKRYL